LWQFEHWQELPGTTCYEADVCHAIQQCSRPGGALQFPGQPPVGYVAEAAERINHPKRTEQREPPELAINECSIVL